MGGRHGTVILTPALIAARTAALRPGIYDMDLKVCTRDDVIWRSITCHPSLYAEQLRLLAHTADTREEREAIKRASETVAEGVIPEVQGYAAKIVLLAAMRCQVIPLRLAAEIEARS